MNSPITTRWPAWLSANQPSENRPRKNVLKAFATPATIDAPRGAQADPCPGSSPAQLERSRFSQVMQQCQVTNSSSEKKAKLERPTDPRLPTPDHRLALIACVVLLVC